MCCSTSPWRPTTPNMHRAPYSSSDIFKPNSEWRDVCRSGNTVPVVRAHIWMEQLLTTCEQDNMSNVSLLGGCSVRFVPTSGFRYSSRWGWGGNKCEKYSGFICSLCLVQIVFWQHESITECKCSLQDWVWNNCWKLDVVCFALCLWTMCTCIIIPWPQYHKRSTQIFVFVRRPPCSHSPAPGWSAPPAPPLAAWAVWGEPAASSARSAWGCSFQKLLRLSSWPLGPQPAAAPRPQQPHSPSLISTSNPGGKLYTNTLSWEISVFQNRATKISWWLEREGLKQTESLGLQGEKHRASGLVNPPGSWGRGGWWKKVVLPHVCPLMNLSLSF